MRHAIPLAALLSLAALARAVDEVPSLELDFENASNRLQNTGSNPNTFTPTGGTSYTAGINGGTALNFDGNYLTANHSPVTTGFTISFWMKTNNAGPNGGGSQWYQGAGLIDGEIGGVTQDWGITLMGDKVALGIGDPDLTTFSTTSVTDGQWHFVAATWSSTAGVAKLYIDGALEGTITGTGHAPRLTDNSFFVGYDANGSYYVGLMDQIRFYNRSFSQSDIQNVQNGVAVSYQMPEVPEPSTYGLALGGLALVGAVIRRRRSK